MQECVYRPWTVGDGMSKRLNSAVPSSSFLLVCNYCVIAQSGFVGVDVYTQAIVQDLGGGGGEQKKKKNTQICIANASGQIWA